MVLVSSESVETKETDLTVVCCRQRMVVLGIRRRANGKPQTLVHHPYVARDRMFEQAHGLDKPNLLAVTVHVNMAATLLREEPQVHQRA